MANLWHSALQSVSSKYAVLGGWHVRRLLAESSAILEGLVWAAAPASAGRAVFVSTPKSGPPGTTIQASDNNDICGIAPDDEVTVSLVPAAGGDAIATVTTETGEDGVWSTTLTVPTDATPGEYSVTAHCRAISEDDESFDYEPNTFTVTGPAPTTTTTPTTVVPEATTTTTTTVAPVMVQAPPAAPVVAQPALTG